MHMVYLISVSPIQNLAERQSLFIFSR